MKRYDERHCGHRFSNMYDALEALTHTFPTGRGPRCIQFSNDCDSLFIGCDDGSVHVIPKLRRVHGSRDHDWTPYSLLDPAQNTAGVTCTTQLEDQRLLIGVRGGRIFEVQPMGIDQWHCLSFSNDFTGDVALLREIAPGLLLVGIAGSPSYLVELGSTISLVRLEFFDLVCAIRHSKDEQASPQWILVSGSARVALLDVSNDSPQLSHLESIPNVGYVSDFALIKPPTNPSEQLCWTKKHVEGLYLATDNGLIVISSDSPERQSRIALPGLSLPIIAVSFFADEHGSKRQNCYLWVSDCMGQSYMFRTSIDAHRKLLNGRVSGEIWTQCSTQQEGVSVTHAFFSWMRPADSNRRQAPLLVARVNSDETVTISYYYSNSSPDLELTELLGNPRETPPEEHGYLQHLTHGNIESLRRISQALATTYDYDYDKWCWTAATLVADLFEWAGEESPADLYDFLLDPKPWLALRALYDEVRDQADDVDNAIRAGHVLQLWTNALLGTLHLSTFMQGKERAYFGILAWLRRVELLAIEQGQPWALKLDFRRAIDECAKIVRKWGTERHILGTSSPHLIGLRDIHRASRATMSRITDEEAVYTAHLLKRRSDTTAVWPIARRPGLTAWDLKVDDHYDNGDTATDTQERYAVLSWSQGIEFYKLSLSSTGSILRGAQASLFTRTWTNCAGPRPVQWDQYSRAVAITRSHKDSRPLVVLARRRVPDNLSRLEILRFPNHEKELFTDLVVDRCPIDEHESVYSLLELEKGLVLVGMRGRGGRPRLGLLLGNDRDEFKFQLIPVDFDPVSPRGEASDRNPVWALALDRWGERPDDTARGDRGPRTSQERHRVVAGCDDGSIWQLQIPKYDILVRAWPNLTESDFRQERVGVLGTAVWSVAVRHCSYDPETETKCAASGREMITRVVAGGGDGSIKCWQRRTRTWTKESKTRWVSIWATKEESPITRVHLYDRISSEPAQTGNEPPVAADDELSPWAILILTQSGRGLVVLDRPLVENPSNRFARMPRRLWVPGQRLDRINLGTSVLASDVLRTSPRYGPWPRILVANEYGQLQLIQPCNLRDDPDTKVVQRNLLVTWKALTRVEHNPFDLRVQEAMAGTSSWLRLPLVEWLVGHHAKLPGWSFFPRRLRLLVMLVSKWNELADPSTHADIKLIPATIGNLVKRVFRRCQQFEDLELYREILERLLDRMNTEIVVALEGSDGILQERVLAISSGVMDALDRTDNLWVGASVHVDVRIKITRTKALVDGVVLRTLSRYVFDEDSGVTPNNQIKKAAQEVLRLRVKLVETLLGEGQILLILEVLRAVNLSLLRYLAWNTSEGLRSLDDLNSDFLPWRLISPYFIRLRSVAGRLAHSGAGLDDALRHEIARAFALACCCCPSRVTLISHLLSEADLPPEAFREVTLQFHALKELTLLDTAKINRLYERVTRWRKTDRQFMMNLEDIRRELGSSTAEREPEDPLDNRGIARQWRQWHELLAELNGIAEALEKRPSEVDATKLADKVNSLKTLGAPAKDFSNRLDTSVGAGSERFYHTQLAWHHVLCELPPSIPSGSADWISALQALAGSTRLHPDLLLKVRPRLIRWCDEARKSFQELSRRHLLFEPQRSAYIATVDRLRSAADGLPRNSAILSHIVVEVLNHGLLESLSDLVFDFVEVVQALDPQYAEYLREPNRLKSPTRGTAHQFVEHLDGYRQNAEDVPKDLWTLKELLTTSPISSADANLEEQFRSIAEHYHMHGTPLSVKPREAKFLRLVLEQLTDNHRKHSGLPGAKAIARWRKRGLQLRFPFKKNTEHYGRLDGYVKDYENGICRSLPPAAHSQGVSHGNGLYIARISLALIGWQMPVRLIELSNDEKREMKLSNGKNAPDAAGFEVTLSPVGHGRRKAISLHDRPL